MAIDEGSPMIAAQSQILYSDNEIYIIEQLDLLAAEVGELSLSIFIGYAPS